MSAPRALRIIAALSLPLAAGLWAAPLAAQAGSPSFDCARANSRAERLICGDRELARMDVEATRVFHLVRDRDTLSEQRKKSLNDDRDQWMKVRDDCWIAEDFRRCIIASYATRIHKLRETHRGALAKDDKGITRGPVAMRCEKMAGRIKATFIRSDPPVSAIELPERVHVGIGAGTRYIERSYYGDLAFWTEGNDAYLKMPDGTRIRCQIDPAPQ